MIGVRLYYRLCLLRLGVSTNELKGYHKADFHSWKDWGDKCEVAAQYSKGDPAAWMIVPESLTISLSFRRI